MFVIHDLNFLYLQSLCCVDKKGILSYPNPSPEKVFFLQNHVEDGQKEHILTESHSHNTELDKDRKTSSKKAETGILNTSGPDILNFFMLISSEMSEEIFHKK